MRRSHHFREKNSANLESKIHFRFEHHVPEKPEHTPRSSVEEERRKKRRLKKRGRKWWRRKKRKRRKRKKGRKKEGRVRMLSDHKAGVVLQHGAGGTFTKKQQQQGASEAGVGKLFDS